MFLFKTSSGKHQGIDVSGAGFSQPHGLSIRRRSFRSLFSKLISVKCSP